MLRNIRIIFFNVSVKKEKIWGDDPRGASQCTKKWPFDKYLAEIG